MILNIKSLTRTVSAILTFLIAVNTYAATPGEDFFNQGVEYGKQGKNKEAVAEYSKAIAANPDLTVAYFNRGFSYEALGEYDKAVADYTKTLEKYPGRPFFLYSRGSALFKKEDFKNALLDLNAAILSWYSVQRKGQMATLSERDIHAFADAYVILGLIHQQEGKPDEVIVDATLSLKILPTADAYNNRGFAYSNKGRMDEAIADFSKAIELEPHYVNAYANRSMAYFEKKQYDKAWEDVHRAEALGGEPPAEFLEELKKTSGRDK